MFYVYLSLMVYIIFFKSFASVAAITRLRLVSAWVQHNLLAAVFHALCIHALWILSFIKKTWKVTIWDSTSFNGTMPTAKNKCRQSTSYLIKFTNINQKKKEKKDVEAFRLNLACNYWFEARWWCVLIPPSLPQMPEHAAAPCCWRAKLGFFRKGCSLTHCDNYCMVMWFCITY